ncbi:MAG: AraC family transcriptional regulator [Oscillospiraceae bacterium]|nr:AraC family transcriptional regulator [Oscillospiraceae bacterium]
MRIHLNNMYRPITAAPFRKNSAYTEIEPCGLLRPYIRCFWGTPAPIDAGTPLHDCGLVVPDTCMDIIFHINYTENCADGIFCALDDRSCLLPEGGISPVKTSVFGIRFYAWTASLFTETPLNGSKNGRFPVDAFFPELKKQLVPMLFETESLTEKVHAAEGILLKNIHTGLSDPDLMNGIYHMIASNGTSKMKDLTSCTGVSERKLERLFDRYTGISPKTMCGLIRYQLLWQDILFDGRFDPSDAVEKYGYFDQAHMLNDFKRRHMMSPREAVSMANEFACEQVTCK